MDRDPGGEHARGGARGISGDVQKIYFGLAAGMSLRRIPG